MTSSRGKRRPRSSTCPTTPHRRRTGMAMTAAMSFLSLINSGSLRPFALTDAFAPPRSAVRPPRRTFAHGLPTSDDGGEALVRGSPIRTNDSRPLARLTHRQEVSLLRRMRANPAHTSIYQVARQTLLLHNLPLVQSIVTKILTSRPHLARPGRGQSAGGNSGSNTSNDYHGSSQRNMSSFAGSSAAESRAGSALTRDDLLHEGTIGLAEAIDRYDLAYAHDDDAAEHPPSDAVLPRGARLGTYATYWIRARILRAIQSREHAVRFPERVLQASHRLARTANEMGLDWQAVGELADYDVISATQEKVREELRERAGIPSDGLFRHAVRVRTMSRFGGTTHLESWMSPSSPAVVANGVDHDGMLSSKEGQEHIRETLAKFLVPREVEVLSLRYGLVSAEESDEIQGDGRAFRDYQAEAEDELFGPEGMLSHYSETPNENNCAPVAVTTLKSADTGGEMKRRTRTHTLLPFKEIGRQMKFSGEYCRRTCTVALDKLTRAVEEGRLAESDFLLGW